jgi:uncharacterized protein
VSGRFHLLVPAPTPAGLRAFVDLVVPHLARQEALHNLHLGVLDGVLAGAYDEAILVAARADSGAGESAGGALADGTPDAGAAADRGPVADVLLRTPPHPLLVPAGAAAAPREALLRWWLEHDPDLPAMVGPLPDVEAAADWWSDRVGAVARRHMHQGIYALYAVRPAKRTPGRLRIAREGDRGTVVPWLTDFQLEALRREEMPGDAVFTSFQGGGVRRLFLWEDPPGRIVAMAGRSGRTPSGVRIGPVYTPPHARGRGYGEAVVAAVAQRELAEGARACFLFTDLDYGTSNRLYARVGYERVGASAEFRFGAT